MKQSANEKIVKALLTSALVVALAEAKTRLKEILDKPNVEVLLYFILISIGFFAIVLIEFVFEKLEELHWFKLLFSRREYIYGLWLNYAEHKETKEIYNFALLRIEHSDTGINIKGETFKAGLKPDGTIQIKRDGVFVSTMAQYQPESGLLGFNFTVRGSEKTLSCNHEIFGSAKYDFAINHGLPLSFQGEFFTDMPPAHCHVSGNRLKGKAVMHHSADVARFTNALTYAIEHKWIDKEQLPIVNSHVNVKARQP